MVQRGRSGDAVALDLSLGREQMLWYLAIAWAVALGVTILFFRGTNRHRYRK